MFSKLISVARNERKYFYKKKKKNISEKVCQALHLPNKMLHIESTLSTKYDMW